MGEIYRKVWPVLAMYAVQHYTSQLMCQSHSWVESGYVSVFELDSWSDWS